MVHMCGGEEEGRRKKEGRVNGGEEMREGKA